MSVRMQKWCPETIEAVTLTAIIFETNSIISDFFHRRHAICGISLVASPPLQLARRGQVRHPWLCPDLESPEATAYQIEGAAAGIQARAAANWGLWAKCCSSQTLSKLLQWRTRCPKPCLGEIWCRRICLLRPKQETSSRCKSRLASSGGTGSRRSSRMAGSGLEGSVCTQHLPASTQGTRPARRSGWNWSFGSWCAGRWNPDWWSMPCSAATQIGNPRSQRASRQPGLPGKTETKSWALSR